MGLWARGDSGPPGGVRPRDERGTLTGVRNPLREVVVVSNPTPDDETQDGATQPATTAAQHPEAAEAVDTKGPVEGSVPEEIDEYATQRGGYGVSVETG